MGHEQNVKDGFNFFVLKNLEDGVAIYRDGGNWILEKRDSFAFEMSFKQLGIQRLW